MKETMGYNKDKVNKMTEAEFLEAFKHHEDDTDLKADYAAIKAEFTPEASVKPGKGKATDVQA